MVLLPLFRSLPQFGPGKVQTESMLIYSDKEAASCQTASAETLMTGGRILIGVDSGLPSSAYPNRQRLTIHNTTVRVNIRPGFHVVRCMASEPIISA